MSEKLLEVKDLCKFFPAGKKKELKAVDHVSFTINKGETLGLVGESGCGKTTCGRTIAKLYDATSGTVLYKGQDTMKFSKQEMLKFRKSVQMIFQDPYSSLDPRMTVAEIIAEGMEVHFKYTVQEKNQKINELLTRVGLNDEFGNRFIHELSGGQRQRIGIARALAVEPEFIICDEPISALDVSIQAQIVNLLIKLQRESDLTYLFISHDLTMVRHISDKVGVMYLGNLVELADSKALFEKQYHPYTKALLSAIPSTEELGAVHKGRKRDVILGEVPSPIDSPSGCKFRTRCPFADEHCAAVVPELREVAPGRFCACHKAV